MTTSSVPVPVFSFQIKYDIVPGLVTVGKYDGSHSCLTAVTSGSKILIHSPHRHGREISFLNMNESVTAILAGRLIPDENKDILAVGSASNLLAYHVDNNSELFFKEMPDGVTAIAMGYLGGYRAPLLIVGGNCSIQGFDWKGEELYWTVTGDVVRSMILTDIDHDGANELIVGSDDYEIRVFKEDSIVGEISEPESVISLIGYKDCKFAYALSNGTVGMYEKSHRMWRLKSKSSIHCLGSYDLDGDGVDELISGWSNGRVDARSSNSGEIIFTDHLAHGIAGIVAGDYRKAGRNQMIVVSQTGEVRGYDSTSLSQDSKIQSDLLRDLFLRKQALVAELKNYSHTNSNTPGIPANTRLIVEINASMANERVKNNHVLLRLSTNNLTLIKSALIFAEGIFEGETLVCHPRTAHVSSVLEIPICPPKDMPVDIDIRAFIGNEARCQQYHVFEVTRPLPRFSMYLLVPYSVFDEPTSYVTFQLVERVQRLDMWLNHNFLVPDVIPVKVSGNTDWCIGVKPLRDGTVVNVKYKSGTMTLATENIELAADIIQSIAAYLNIDKLESFAELPKLFDQIEMMLGQIVDLRQNSTKMSATVADNATVIRTLVVQAEDARILQHFQDMRDRYTQLYQVNEEVIKNHKLFCNNHEELLKILKKLNLTIQHASRLRVGKNKSEIISQCRQAIATNNLNELIKLIKTGRD